MPTIPATALNAFATDLLLASGLSREEATLVAQNLVGANLRGYDSHGVMRIPYYLEQVRKGAHICPAVGFPVQSGLIESPLAVGIKVLLFGRPRVTRFGSRTSSGGLPSNSTDVTISILGGRCRTFCFGRGSR